MKKQLLIFALLSISGVAFGMNRPGQITIRTLTVEEFNQVRQSFKSNPKKTYIFTADGLKRKESDDSRKAKALKVAKPQTKSKVTFSSRPNCHQEIVFLHRIDAEERESRRQHWNAIKKQATVLNDQHDDSAILLLTHKHDETPTAFDQEEQQRLLLAYNNTELNEVIIPDALAMQKANKAEMQPLVQRAQQIVARSQSSQP